jgi:hypothetical protein
MKTKIIIGLILLLIIQLNSYGQFELYDLQFQMNMQQIQQQTQQQIQQMDKQMNQILNNINKEHHYYCTDGKILLCTFGISRISGGFTNSTAFIQNWDRTKKEKLEVDPTGSTHLSVRRIGEHDWDLDYGDRITISSNGNVSEFFDIGVDDNMSEVDWNAYKDQLINESKQQIQRDIENKSIQQQINNSAIVYPTIQPYNNSSRSNLRLVKVTCPSCRGTGISNGWSTVAAYGSSQEKWCPNCNKWVSATHGPHLQCIPCQGKGYTESYVP